MRAHTIEILLNSYVSHNYIIQCSSSVHATLNLFGGPIVPFLPTVQLSAKKKKHDSTCNRKKFQFFLHLPLNREPLKDKRRSLYSVLL